MMCYFSCEWIHSFIQKLLETCILHTILPKPNTSFILCASHVSPYQLHYYFNFIVAMMAAASLFITRWKYTTIPAILFLSYTSLQIYQARNKETTGPLITTFDIISPLCISTGILLMFFGRSDSEQGPWTKTFWAGEALVMTLFCLNTLSSREATTLRPSLPLSLGLYFIFGLLALYIRGKGWRYISCLSIELGCALVAVLVFPMMEMLMETLIDEKLKKVGERVRLYSKVMEETYQAKLEELEKKNNSQESSSYVGGPSVIVTEELD